MPRIWVGNIEEVFAPRDDIDDKTILKKADALAPRFLYHGDPGDVIILSRGVDRDFADYVTRLNGLSRPPIRVLVPKTRVSPYFLTDAVLADAALLATLRQTVARGDWKLEPYIETPGVLRLASALGLSAGRTAPKLVEAGLIQEMNDKQAFKKLAGECRIPCIQGSAATDIDSLKDQIRTMESDGHARLMLRRSYSGGGMGNLAGTPRELLAKMDGWYRSGTVLVEPFIDFVETLGSLVCINETESVFLGVDAQNFIGGRWAGFRFPFERATIADLVRSYSSRVAENLWKKGVRGYLNLDWGITRTANGAEEVLALEQNVRHNGFSHILHLRDRLFAGQRKPSHIFYLDPISCPLHGRWSFRKLLGILAENPLKKESILIETMPRESGVIPVLPPKSGTCGLLFFGTSAEEVVYLRSAVDKVFTGNIR